jgi:hypothetical protein
MSGWPDKTRPGVPLNPERCEWHWIDNGRQFPAVWLPTANVWNGDGSNVSARTAAKRGWIYIGPCLTPAELAAREAAAFKRGAEAMQEQCAVAAESHPNNLSPNGRTFSHGYANGALDAARAIRALPLPEDHAACQTCDSAGRCTYACGAQP